MDLTTKTYNGISGMSGDSTTLSTAIPSTFTEDPNTIVTIVVVVVAVILTIILLFGMAVFIDCRHQKLVKSGKQPISEWKLFRLPSFFKFRRFSNDEDSYIDKMYEDENAIA